MSGEHEFLLMDRLQKIKQIIGKYGEENFCVSYSGGKDSTVLSELLDLAVPGNNIPRIYADTGIELIMIRDFVKNKQAKDSRIVILKPSVPVKKTLETEGYPFKSKKHSECVATYQRNKTIEGHPGLQHYLRLNDGEKWSQQKTCPNILMYQFTPEFKMKISDKCCLRMKEEPIRKWQKENKKAYVMIGLMREEGGRRSDAKCLVFQGDKLKKFQPMVALTKEWEEWFIDTYHIEICDIYKPPYNFKRTGCKGCPFNARLQEELDTLSKYLPGERKQCELIWKPVYDEYRRLGYRLQADEQIEGQMNLSDFVDG